MAHKTFFGKLFGWIGDIFENAAKKLWDNLSDEEKQNLIHGSGIIDIINRHLEDVPKVITDAIQTEFPDVDLKLLEDSLLSICTELGIKLPEVNLDNTIIAIQGWLKDKEGEVWKWASQSIAELLSVLLNKDSVFEKIGMLIQYVYDTFIKKD